MFVLRWSNKYILTTVRPGWHKFSSEPHSEITLLLHKQSHQCVETGAGRWLLINKNNREHGGVFLWHVFGTCLGLFLWVSRAARQAEIPVELFVSVIGIVRS